jgi:hypothetical protein
MSAGLKEIIASVRQVIAECEDLAAVFRQTGKKSDHRAWKRKGGVLELWSVGSIRRLIDGYEAADARITSLEEENARLREALEGVVPSPLCGEAWNLPDNETAPITITFGSLRTARAALSIRGEG